VRARGGGRGRILVTITPLDPIGLHFDMDQRSYLHYQRLLDERQVAGGGARLRVGLAGEDGFPHPATLTRFDAEFNAETGTIGVHGTLPNPGCLLLPGMFARVRVPFGKPRQALMVPAEAVGTDQGRHFVWVVNDRNVVDRREVRLGPAEDGMRVIEAGLHPEEWVVTAGATRLRPGDRVEPRRAPTRGSRGGPDRDK
jgi:multidrug efflux system membrane fusion protein